jgi:hypothetical protein
VEWPTKMKNPEPLGDSGFLTPIRHATLAVEGSGGWGTRQR